MVLDIKRVILPIFIGIFSLSCGNSSLDESTLYRIQKLLPPKDGGVYFGAFADFGHSEHDVTKNKIRDFENLAKKKLAWVYISNNWGEGIVYPKDDIHTIYNSGATPFIRMMPRSDNKQINQSEDSKFTLQKIIDGTFDKELREWAIDAKADNIPLLVDFGLEMTGFWFQWSGKFSGAGKLDGYGDPTYPDGPERFRDAYRHIIDLFRDVGVKHITWFFHPDIQRLPDEEWNSAKYYYPGDDYIDWIGFSIYGVQNEKWGWIYFSDTLKKWYEKHIKDIVGSKPVAVLEMGVTDGRSDGSKKEWLEDAFRTILDNPYMKFSGAIYWHENWLTPSGVESRLRIDSSAESLETFQRLISNPRFISKSIFTNHSI